MPALGTLMIPYFACLCYMIDPSSEIAMQILGRFEAIMNSYKPYRMSNRKSIRRTRISLAKLAADASPS